MGALLGGMFIYFGLLAVANAIRFVAARLPAAPAKEPSA